MKHTKPNLQKNGASVEVKNVWESFRIYHHKNYTLKDTLVRLKKSAYEEFWALKDVSFKVRRGETLGIIGENGSGKSTLLKCIAGILEPSRGKININGRISPLLELGAGFHPELSGRENIYINGAILGLSKNQIDQLYEKIVSFSELEKFIDTQVKFYSSGMYIRLGFAIAVFSSPDILLIDEVLAVGDERFKKKSFDKMKELQSQGTTIILVTHDMGAAHKFCDKLILLENGKIVETGRPKKIARKYVDGAIEEEAATERGTKEIILKNLKFLGDNGQPCKKLLSPGEAIVIKADYEAIKKIRDPIFGIEISDQQGNMLFGTNTKINKIKTGTIEGHGSINFSLANLPMVDGKYYITVAIVTDEDEAYHWLDHHFMFEIKGKTDDAGLMYIPTKIELKSNNKPAKKAIELAIKKTV